MYLSFLLLTTHSSIKLDAHNYYVQTKQYPTLAGLPQTLSRQKSQGHALSATPYDAAMQVYQDADLMSHFSTAFYDPSQLQ